MKWKKRRSLFYRVIERADWLSALWRQVWDPKKSIEWRESYQASSLFFSRNITDKTNTYKRASSMVKNKVYERHELDSSLELITACCRLGSCEGTFSVIESSSHPDETIKATITVAECDNIGGRVSVVLIDGGRVLRNAT